MRELPTREPYPGPGQGMIRVIGVEWIPSMLCVCLVMKHLHLGRIIIVYHELPRALRSVRRIFHELHEITA